MRVSDHHEWCPFTQQITFGSINFRFGFFNSRIIFDWTKRAKEKNIIGKSHLIAVKSCGGNYSQHFKWYTRHIIAGKDESLNDDSNEDSFTFEPSVSFIAFVKKSGAFVKKRLSFAFKHEQNMNLMNELARMFKLLVYFCKWLHLKSF